MAYNPDAIYGQQLGVQAALPAASLTRMNELGQPPQRARCAKEPQLKARRRSSLFLPQIEMVSLWIRAALLALQIHP